MKAWALQKGGPGMSVPFPSSGMKQERRPDDSLLVDSSALLVRVAADSDAPRGLCRGIRVLVQALQDKVSVSILF